MAKVYAVVIVLALAMIGIRASTFIVTETQKAIQLRFGEIKRADYTPGLYFKIPFIESVVRFDSRILTLDTPAEQALTSEKKNVIVDSFVKWRIEDVENFYRETGGDETRALRLLTQIVRKGVLDSFGKRTVSDVISGERKALMEEVRNDANAASIELGIEIIDVRVKKVEFPNEVNDSIYRRMEKERATVAKAFRSEGQELAKGIRADAERQREEILAEAYAESQEIRGEGDAVATRVYANSYSQDPEFYSFYRSLNAYRSTFKGRNDVIILNPDSEFFKYFSDPDGN